MKSNIYEIIGANIKETRKIKGIKQIDLATELGFGATHLSHLENGTTKLPLDVFLEINRILETNVYDLLNGTIYIWPDYEKVEIMSELEDIEPEMLSVVHTLIKSLKKLAKDQKKKYSLV